jgi:hypothetical protein
MKQRTRKKQSNGRLPPEPPADISDEELDALLREVETVQAEGRQLGASEYACGYTALGALYWEVTHGHQPVGPAARRYLRDVLEFYRVERPRVYDDTRRWAFRLARACRCDPHIPGPRERHQQRTMCSSVQITLRERIWFVATGADLQNRDSCGGGADRSALRKGGTRRFAPSNSVSGLVLVRALCLC